MRDPGPAGEEGEDAVGGAMVGAVGSESGVAVAFGEAATVGAEDEGDVSVTGDTAGETERVEEEGLAGDGVEQVVAADDVGDSGVGVVDGAGELVGGGAVGFEDGEVAEGVGGNCHFAAEVVDEGEVGGGEAETEGGVATGGGEGGGWGGEAVSAGAGIDGGAVGGVGCRGCRVDFGSATHAGVGGVRGKQHIDRDTVAGEVL